MQVQESQQKAWWEEFLNEFFQENATLVIEVDLGEGTRKYRKWTRWKRVPLLIIASSIMHPLLYTVHYEHTKYTQVVVIKLCGSQTTTLHDLSLITVHHLLLNNNIHQLRTLPYRSHCHATTLCTEQAT